VRTWLPGDVWFETRIDLPQGIEPGPVRVAAGLVDPATRRARVRFAVKEQTVQGWVDLGVVEVTEGGDS